MIYTPEIIKMIHIISILLFGPLLIMIGLLGKKTPKLFFMICLVLGVIMVFYHSTALYEDMMNKLDEGFKNMLR